MFTGPIVENSSSFQPLQEQTYPNFEKPEYPASNFWGKIHELAIEKIPVEQSVMDSFSKALKALQNQKYHKISEFVIKLRDHNGRTLFQAMIQEAPLEKISAFEMDYSNTPCLQELAPQEEYDRVLVYAAEKNRIDLWSLYRSNSPAIPIGKGGETELHVAIQAHALEYISKLLEYYRQDVHVLLQPRWLDPVTGYYLSPLALAIARGNTDSLDMLLKYAGSHLLRRETIHGVGNVLHLAIICDQIDMLQHLMSCLSWYSICNQKGYPHRLTPIELARKKGKPDAINILTPRSKKKSQSDNESIEQIDSGPLFQAIQQKNAQEVFNLFKNLRLTQMHALLQYTQKDQVTGYDLSPTALAIVLGYKEYFCSLPKRAFKTDIFSEIIYSVGNLLHLTIQTKQFKMLQYLLETHTRYTFPLINDTRNHPLKQTPLHTAAEIGAIEAILILGLFKAYLEAQDHLGRTPLHLAALNGHLETIRWLLFLGASPPSKDVYGRQPSECIKILSHLSPILHKRNKATIKTLLTTATLDAQKRQERPPNFLVRPPRIMVIQGGGPKGVAYGPLFERMDAAGLLSDLEIVAGTSAGAIYAACLAVGYNGKEALKILKDVDLLKLLDVIDSATIEGDVHTLLNVANGTFFKSGLCTGDAFHEWMGYLIKEKTGNRDFTFGQLRKKIQQGNREYKHLFVYFVEQGTNQKIVEINSIEDEHDDRALRDMVRNSISIPVLFEPGRDYEIRKGKRKLVSDKKIFYDGGTALNLPFEDFHKKRFCRGFAFDAAGGDQPMYNPDVLAISLVDPKSKKAEVSNTNPSKLTVGFELASTRWNTEKLLRKRFKYYKHHIIKVDNCGVGLTDFNMTKKQKKNLLEAGEEAYDDFFNFVDTQGISPKKYLDFNSEQTQKLLSKYIKLHPINRPDKKGITKLQWAIKKKRWQIMQRLLSDPFIDVNVQNSEGQTALHIAATYKKIRALEELIKQPGLNVNAVDKMGRTPLHCAIIAKVDGKFLETFLTHPELNLTLKDKAGKTPLDLTTSTHNQQKSSDYWEVITKDPRIWQD